jgi:hypothetical protein
MSTYVNVNSLQEVDLDFSHDNCDIILEKFKKWNDISKKYNTEDLEKLDDVLYMLNKSNITFCVDADVDEVEMSDDEIEEAYSDIHAFDNDGTYDDGYDAKVEELEKRQKQLKQCYCSLFNKLERISNGFEKKESLTDNDIEQLRDILNEELL